MILTYKPDGEEPQKWHVKYRKLRTKEAAELQRMAGAKNFPEFQERTLRGDADALRVLAFFHLRKIHPALKLDDFDPLMEEIDLDYDREEMERIREQTLKDPTVTAVQKQLLDAAVEAAEEAPPKAISSSAA